MIQKWVQQDPEPGSAIRPLVETGPGANQLGPERDPTRNILGSAAEKAESDPGHRSDDPPSWQPGALDPLALFGVGSSAGPVPAAVAAAPAALDPLVGELLRSIAWGGDRRRGTARIELGSGRYGGTSVKVDVVGNTLQIELEAPPGIDASALGARLVERFEARGLRVDSLTWR